MNQGPLFRRPSSAVPVAAKHTQGPEVEYLRLQAHAENPGALLGGVELHLIAGGMLDVVTEKHGGLGLGSVAYTPGLLAAIKRGGPHHTYRFQVPADAQAGSRFVVTCHGHDRLAAFSFTVIVSKS